MQEICLELNGSAKRNAMFRTFEGNEMLLSFVIPILLNTHYLLEACISQVQNVNLLFPLEQMPHSGTTGTASVGNSLLEWNLGLCHLALETSFRCLKWNIFFLDSWSRFLVWITLSGIPFIFTDIRGNERKQASNLPIRCRYLKLGISYTPQLWLYYTTPGTMLHKWWSFFIFHSTSLRNWSLIHNLIIKKTEW